MSDHNHNHVNLSVCYGRNVYQNRQALRCALTNLEPFSASNLRGEPRSSRYGTGTGIMQPSTPNYPNPEYDMLHLGPTSDDPDQANDVDYVVRSYETPIAWHTRSDDVWHITSAKYSRSTTRQQQQIKLALDPQATWWDRSA